MRAWRSIIRRTRDEKAHSVVYGRISAFIKAARGGEYGGELRTCLLYTSGVAATLFDYEKGLTAENAVTVEKENVEMVAAAQDAQQEAQPRCV